MASDGDKGPRTSGGLSEAFTGVGGRGVDDGDSGMAVMPESLLRASLDALQEAFFIFEAVRDEDGAVVDLRYRFMNAAAEQLYQRSSVEILGRGLVELFPTVIDLGIFACYVEPLTTGLPSAMRVPSFDDNGVAGAFDIASSPFGDGVVVTAHDVTGHVAAERALAESEARYRLLIENSADVVFHTVEGVVRYVSPAVERVFGWTVEDLLGRTTVHLCHPDDVATAVALRDAVYAGQPGRGVLRFRMKSGTYAWIEATMRPVDAAQGGGMVATLRDVSGQVEAEEALRRSEEQFRRLADNATDVVYLSGRDRRVRWIAPTVTRALGWTPEELVGTSIGDLMHPDDLRATAQVRSTAYGGRDPGEADGGYYVRLRTKSGQYRWMAGHMAVVHAEDGTHMGLVVGLKDVDDLVRARDAAEADQARLRATIDSLLDPHVLLEAVRDESNAIVDFTYVDANQAAARDLRRDLGEVMGAAFTGMAPGAAAAGMVELLIVAVTTGRPLKLDDFTYPNPDCPSQNLHYDIRAVRVGDGLSVTWRDVTERQQSVAAITASEERYRLLAENSSDVVIRVRDGVVLWASPSITDALGWTPHDVQDHPVGEFVHPEDLDRVVTDQADVNAGTAGSSRFRLRAKDGSYHWVENHGRPYLDGSGSQDGLVVSAHVVDQEVATQRELDWRARHDELTGLLNRQEVLDRLASIGTHARRSGDEYAVVFCDLDGLKAVNDDFGHSAGDTLLRAVATRISDAVRSRDTVARVGGDEILIVLDGVHDIDEAAAIANKVRLAVKEAVAVDGGEIRPTLSIGVTVARPNEGVDAMITRADEAMYQAKRGGRDRVIQITTS